MPAFYFSIDLGKDRVLCLSPLSERNRIISGQDIEDSSGYFLFEKRGGRDATEIEIIAQIPSDEAAFRLKDMLGMS